MRVHASDTSHLGPANLFDLDTAEAITAVVEFDSDEGWIRRCVLDERGRVQPTPDGTEVLTVTEQRRFRVVHALTGAEICRTAGGFSPEAGAALGRAITRL